MSLIVTLPTNVLSSLLTSWLTIVEVAHLDSAYCNMTLRVEFVRTAYESEMALEFKGDWMESNDTMSEWILQRGVLVTSMHATSAFLSNHKMRTAYLARHGRSIQSVECGYLFGSKNRNLDYNPAAVDIAKFCPNLKKFITTQHIGNKYLVNIIKSCPLLETLALRSGECTAPFIKTIATACTKLTQLELDGENLNEQDLTKLVRNNPCLTTLTVSGGGAADQFLYQLAISCKQLTTLSITGHEAERKLSLSALVSFLVKSQSLTSLSLSTCRIVPDNHPPAVMETEPFECNNLKSLKLEGVALTDAVLDELLWACPGLTEIEIGGCSNLRDVGAFRLGTRYPALQKLIMCDNYGGDGSDGSDSENGESRSVSDCDVGSVESVDSTGTEDSRADCSTHVTDHLLIDLSENCLDLYYLDVSESLEVTDEGIIALITECSLLSELNLTGCAYLTNATLAALAKHSRNLQKLCMVRCTQITDAGVAKIMQGCPKLSYLNIEKCNGTTKKMRQAARELHSTLKV
jgi:hypothetical protein